MAYKYSFRQSPNYTPGSQTRAVWGRNRVVEKIAIHWWGDPKTNPTFEGVVNVLCNPARQASAHYVAEAGRVAQLVNEADNSWATNSANPYTISIECNPKGRAGDFATISELIAAIWKRLGRKGLIRHKDIVATQCPGVFSGQLKRLIDGANKHLAPKPNPAPTWVKADKPRKMVVLSATDIIDLVSGKKQGTVAKDSKVDIASKTKYGGKYYLRSKYATQSKKNWGMLRAKFGEIAPTPPPTPTKPEWEVNKLDYDRSAILYANKDGVRLYDITTGKIDTTVAPFPSGRIFDAVTRETTVKGQRYFISKYSADMDVWKGFKAQDLDVEAPRPPAPKPNDPTPDSVAGVDRIGAIEKRLGLIEAAVAWIIGLLEKLGIKR